MNLAELADVLHVIHNTGANAATIEYVNRNNHARHGHTSIHVADAATHARICTALGITATSRVNNANSATLGGFDEARDLGVYATVEREPQPGQADILDELGVTA